MGSPALALTDHGTLSGALHHIQACWNKDSSGKPVREGDPIIPICGVEAYFRKDRSERDKDHRSANHLTVFAKNLKGWHSLLRLTSRAYEDNREGGGFYQYPCVDTDLLREHGEGLIIMSGCISGYLSTQIKLGDDIEAERYIEEMLDIFGDDFYFEIQPHDFAEQKFVNVEVANYATKYGRPVVTGCDAHAPYKDWVTTQQVAKLMSTKSSFEKEKKRQEKGDVPDEGFAKLLPTAYMMDEKTVRKLYADAHPDLPESVVDESIKSTVTLAKTCKPFMLDKRNKLPRVSKDEAHAEKILREWCEEGLERIGKTDDQEYLDRYEFEFGVLKEKGVLDYFVLTGDMVRWARAQGIMVNVRGSAAGCLVSYLIGIVAIDPIGWGLLFERFLNPGRKGLPDIDLDFQDDRRDEVKQYLADKYGRDHIADIIAHQTFQPKAAILDVGRAFDVPYTEVESLNKTIDIRADDEETTLEQIRQINPDLDAFAEKYPEVWMHATRLEGTVRNQSKHAAGVVITDRPITDYIPLERGKKGDHVTSWSDRADFPAVSDHGLVKLDILGIKGLTKQATALNLIEERHGEKPDLNALGVMTDPADVDEKVMEIFTKGMTLGVWQFASRGITNLLKQIKPDWAGDICAANALYRPGPMGRGSTWEYAELKLMPEEELDYWHPDIKDILLETYGIIAYQEQVMNVCKQLGGFTGGQADDMRKAMGKLYRLKGDAAQRYMAQFKSTWDAGCKSNGMALELSEEIWHKILAFGGYGFNKSHSASYAVQAYHDAWLKTYFAPEFYCALLMHPPSTVESAKGKAKFMQAIFRESEEFGVTIAPPDINISGRRFTLGMINTPDENKLLYGLRAIKDVGDSAAAAILEHRPFESWDDFMERCGKKGEVKVNVSARTGLIESGACDRWDMRAGNSGAEISRMEKQRLGVTLTMTGEAQQHKELIAENIYTPEEIEDLEDKREVIVGGDVIDVSETTVKKKGPMQGRDMAFVTIAFGTNQWRVTFFPDLWDSYRDLVESGAMMIAGKKDTFRNEVSIIANQCASIEEWVQTVQEEDREESFAS